MVEAVAELLLSAGEAIEKLEMVLPKPTPGLEADREWLETRNRWRREAERHGRSEQAWKALNARTHALLKSPVAR